MVDTAIRLEQKVSILEGLVKLHPVKDLKDDLTQAKEELNNHIRRMTCEKGTT